MSKSYIKNVYEQHRSMWLCIAGVINKTKRSVYIPEIKRAYYDMYVDKSLYDLTNYHYCFLCWLFGIDCYECHKFLKLKNNRLMCLGGFYNACYNETDWKKQQELATIIANIKSVKKRMFD